MNLPSKESFESFIALGEVNLVDSFKKTPLINSFQKKKIKDITIDDVSEVVKFFDKSLIDLFKSSKNHEIYKWLAEQENFKKAINSMFYKSNVKSKSFLSKKENDFNKVNYVYKRLIDGGDPLYTLYKLYDPYRIARFGVIMGVSKSLYSYFYTNRALGIYHANQNLNVAIQKCNESLNLLFSFSEYSEFMNSDSITPFLKSSSSERFRRKLADMNVSFPIERKDRTMKERVLIYDFDSSFKRYFRTSKSNAIFYLLMLDGIENNLEKRTIERVLEKWRNESQAKKILK